MMDREDAQRSPAEWFLAIHVASDPAPETIQAWLQWMDDSAENRQAFEDIVQVWQRTPSAVLARTTDSAEDEGYDGAISVAEWRAKRAATEGMRNDLPAPRASRAVRPGWAQRIPMKAALAASLAVGSLLIYRARLPAAIHEGVFSAGTNQQRQISLADGSAVTLGAHSRLVVHLGNRSRDLRLESGEAYFSVHRDPSRPFVVTAFDSAITAIGTAFNVRALQDRVTVTVSEGSVKVTERRPDADFPDASQTSGEHSASLPSGRRRSGEGKPLESRLLERGEQLTVVQRADGALQPQARRRVDAAESTRWREGWLVYRDEPLGYVIADVARYTDLPLTTSDSAAELRFSGTVFKDNIAEWIAALPNVVNVSVSSEGEGFHIVGRAAALDRSDAVVHSDATDAAVRQR